MKWRSTFDVICNRKVLIDKTVKKDLDLNGLSIDMVYESTQ